MNGAKSSRRGINDGEDCLPSSGLWFKGRRLIWLKLSTRLGENDAMADMAHLIEPVIPSLRRYARTFVRDPGAADDLVQDTLERAISRWHQRRSDADTRTWLFTILHNLAVNHLRRTARRGREIALDDAGESDVAVPSTQEDALRHEDILAAVGQLPDDQRGVLVLVSIEDVSYAEAARILDIPIGTVMSRLARARVRLLKLVEEQGKVASDRPYLRRVQ
jgi:RNA polymerase sigma factor (sigma-70 family)